MLQLSSAWCLARGKTACGSPLFTSVPSVRKFVVSVAEESLPGSVSSSAASPIRAGPAAGSETSQDGVRAARDGRHQTLDQETSPLVSGGTRTIHFLLSRELQLLPA